MENRATVLLGDYRTYLVGALALFAVDVSAQVGNFDSLNVYAAPSEAGLAEIRRLSVNEDGMETDRPDIAVGFSSNDLRIDQDTGRFERDAHWDSVQFSVGYRAGDLRYGLLSSFQDGEIGAMEINSDVPNPAFGDIARDGWLGGAYIGYDLNSFSIELIAGTGSSDNAAERSSDLGPTYGRSTSKFETESAFLIATLRMEKQLPRSMSVSPFLRLGYAEIETDGFEESGGPDRRIVSGFRESDDFFELGAILSTGELWYSPELSLSYWHDFSNDDLTLEIDASDGSNLGTLLVPSSSENLFMGSVVIDNEFADNWNMRLSFDYANGDSEDFIGLGCNLGLRF